MTAELKKCRYVYYHCTGNRGPCPKPYVREEQIAADYCRVLDSVKVPAHIVEWVAEKLARESRDSVGLVEQRRARLAAEERKLLLKLEKLYVDFSDGRLGTETYESLRTKSA